MDSTRAGSAQLHKNRRKEYYYYGEQQRTRLGRADRSPYIQTGSSGKKPTFLRKPRLSGQHRKGLSYAGN